MISAIVMAALIRLRRLQRLLWLLRFLLLLHGLQRLLWFHLVHGLQRLLRLLR